MSTTGLTVTGLVPILGNPDHVGPEATKLIAALLSRKLKYPPWLSIRLLVDGAVWRRLLNLPNKPHPSLSISYCTAHGDLPAVLLNAGAQAAHSDLLAFLWPGLELAPWIEQVGELARTAAVASHRSIVASSRLPGKQRPHPFQSWIPDAGDELPPGYDGGWLEMQDLIPMQSSVVDRAFFLSKGGFSTDRLLQRGFWWDLTVRTTRGDSVRRIDMVAQDALWSWWDYPLNVSAPVSGDLVARRVMRYSNGAATVRLAPDPDTSASFLSDLPASVRSRFPEVASPAAASRSAAPKGRGAPADDAFPPHKDPLRVLVIAGPNEPAHNQLCFFNYFRLLEGRGILTWRTVLDTAAYPLDLHKSDLVVFSRCKSPAASRLMDECRSLRIPTVYMLDDNWFSIAQDWPEYASVFCPGAPLFDNFLHCLQNADHVLTYNEILAEDLRPYSKQLHILPTNIDLEPFQSSAPAPGGPVRVGYVGSIRKETAAFKALAELASERRDFEIVVMSQVVPPALQAIPPERLEFKPYVFGYRQYAQQLCASGLQVMLAPLQATRTDASKCPNKYLEITACGAVGVYSNTSPYDQYVTSGRNGILADNNVESWKRGITNLLDDAALRRSVLESARQDVMANFRTEAVLPRFLQFLRAAATNGSLSDKPR